MDEMNHIPGPWQVRCNIQTGNTLYGVRRHTHTAIALDEAYWPADRVPPVDGDNYCQPDEFADIEEHRIATARLIAAAPDLLEAVLAIKNAIDTGIEVRGLGEQMLFGEAIEKCRTSLEKAMGANPTDGEVRKS